MTEHRTFRDVELRAVALPDGAPGVVLQAVTPYVVDDYGSVWMPGVFDRSLEQRLPALCWAHDWADPIGPGVDWSRAGEAGPQVSFRFSDFEAVPQARRAHAQVSDGTIRDCSVGFSNVRRRPPTAKEEARWPGVVEVIEDADLDEVSLVLRGAVPGAKVLSVRTGQRSATVDLDAVVEVGRKVAAGELTHDEGKATLALLAEDAGDPAGDPDPDPGDGDGQAEAADIEAAADAALDQLGRSARR